MRPSIDSARTVLPRNSITWPVPPSTPSAPITCRVRSLAPTPGASGPSMVTRQRLGLALQQALRGQHVADLGGADAEGQRAEGAVGGGVAVAADDGHAGLGPAQFGRHHVHDAAVGRIPARQRDAEFAAVALEFLDLGAGGRVGVGAAAVRGRRQGRASNDPGCRRVRAGWRTRSPRSRSTVKACGEVTSWIRCRSMYSTAGRPSSGCSTRCASQSLSKSVRAVMAAVAVPGCRRGRWLRFRSAPGARRAPARSRRCGWRLRARRAPRPRSRRC